MLLPLFWGCDIRYLRQIHTTWVVTRLKDLDTIIFDLGEVIIDLDPKAVMREFESLTETNGQEIRNLIVTSPLLFQYETGQLSCSGFIHEVNLLLKSEISDDDFRNAWNLMIKGVSIRRLNFMEELMKTHQVILLSNTNKMHEDYFDELVVKIGGKLMKEYSHTAYYSHDIGYRKPNRDIYDFVIKEQSLDPERTVFLDDRLENIDAALSVGLQAIQVEFPDQIFEILKHE